MMPNRWTLLHFEIKKILKSKLAVLALILSAGMLFGVSMIDYVLISPYHAHVYERERELEDHPIDKVFLAEVSAESEVAGGLSDIEPDNLYYYVAQYINRLQGAYLTIGGVSAEALNEVPVVEQRNPEKKEVTLYARREKVLEYLYDYYQLSDNDRAWWNEKENDIPKPFIWKSNFGFYSMKSNFSATVNLFCIIASVSLAGVFAGEKSQRTDALVLCTKEGKKSLWLTKFAAGELFSFTAGTTLLTAAQLPHLIFNGLHGIDAAWQLIVPFSSYPYKAGHMLFLWVVDYYLACFAVGALVMLLSILIGNAIASAGIMCVAVILDLFVTLPPQYGTFSQLRYLTPGQVLINTSMADPRLLSAFGLKLTSLQSAGILYVAVILMSLLLIDVKYRRLEAE